MNRFFLALSAALMFAAPAFAHADPVLFRGALLDSDTPLRVRNAAVYWSEDGPAATPVEQLTREQLQAEYQRLDHERPTLGGPIALTAVGGALAIIGFGVAGGGVSWLLYAGTRGAYGIAGYILVGFAAVMVITGAVLLAVGMVKLFARIGERRGYSQRMEDINARLESLDRTGTPPEETPPPPPLPPPPPGAGRFDVPPSLLVASF